MHKRRKFHIKTRKKIIHDLIENCFLNPLFKREQRNELESYGSASIPIHVEVATAAISASIMTLDCETFILLLELTLLAI